MSGRTGEPGATPVRKRPEGPTNTICVPSGEKAGSLPATSGVGFEPSAYATYTVTVLTGRRWDVVTGPVGGRWGAVTVVVVRRWNASRSPDGEKLGAESSGPVVSRSWSPVAGSTAQMLCSAEYAITPFAPGKEPSATVGVSSAAIAPTTAIAPSAGELRHRGVMVAARIQNSPTRRKVGI